MRYFSGTMTLAALVAWPALAQQAADDVAPEAEIGRPAVDHARCTFVREGEGWVLEDACMATFAPATPAS